MGKINKPTDEQTSTSIKFPPGNKLAEFFSSVEIILASKLFLGGKFPDEIIFFRKIIFIMNIVLQIIIIFN